MQHDGGPPPNHVVERRLRAAFMQSCRFGFALLAVPLMTLAIDRGCRGVHTLTGVFVTTWQASKSARGRKGWCADDDVAYVGMRWVLSSCLVDDKCCGSVGAGGAGGCGPLAFRFNLHPVCQLDYGSVFSSVSGHIASTTGPTGLCPPSSALSASGRRHPTVFALTNVGGWCSHSFWKDHARRPCRRSRHGLAVFGNARLFDSQHVQRAVRWLVFVLLVARGNHAMVMPSCVSELSS